MLTITKIFCTGQPLLRQTYAIDDGNANILNPTDFPNARTVSRMLFRDPSNSSSSTSTRSVLFAYFGNNILSII